MTDPADTARALQSRLLAWADSNAGDDTEDHLEIEGLMREAAAALSAAREEGRQQALEREPITCPACGETWRGVSDLQRMSHQLLDRAAQAEAALTEAQARIIRLEASVDTAAVAEVCEDLGNEIIEEQRKREQAEAERDALKAEVDAETARADRAEWLHDHAPTGRQPGPHPACGCDYCKLGADLARLRADYDELIMAVANKHPGETRHQTALRYIQRAETPDPHPAAMKERL